MYTYSPPFLTEASEATKGMHREGCTRAQVGSKFYEYLTPSLGLYN